MLRRWRGSRSLPAVATAAAALAGLMLLPPGLAAGPPPPSATAVAGMRQKAEQALRQGNLRQGCPWLRQAIDGTGALYARTPTPALRTELRQLSQLLEPCLRKGL